MIASTAIVSYVRSAFGRRNAMALSHFIDSQKIDQTYFLPNQGTSCSFIRHSTNHHLFRDNFSHCRFDDTPNQLPCSAGQGCRGGCTPREWNLMITRKRYSSIMELGSPLFSRGIATFVVILPYLVINICVLFKRPIEVFWSVPS